MTLGDEGYEWSADDLDAAMLDRLDLDVVVDEPTDPVGPHGANTPGETDA